MTDVALKYEDIRNAATRLGTAKKDMESKLAELQTMITALKGSGFQTQTASEKFQNSYEQWTNGTKASIAGLDGMASFLNQAATKHQELDSQLTSGLQQQ